MRIKLLFKSFLLQRINLVVKTKINENSLHECDLLGLLRESR